MAQSLPLIAPGEPTLAARTGEDSGTTTDSDLLRTVTVRAPEAGKRIEIEITSQRALRVAVDSPTPVPNWSTARSK